MYFLIVNIDNRQYKTFHIPQMFLIKAPGKNQAHGNLNKDLTGTLEKYFGALPSGFVIFSNAKYDKKKERRKTISEIGMVLMSKTGV